MRIFGYIDEDGAGTAGTGHIEGFAQDPGQLIGVGNQVVVLGDRKRDAGDVSFLKGVGADQLAAHLPGDAHDGRRIQHRGGDAGDHVGRPRPRSRNRHSNLATGPGIAVRHVGGALLVAHQDVVDIAMLQGVIRRQNCASGIAENVLYALALQALPKNLCSRFCHEPSPQSFQPSN